MIAVLKEPQWGRPRKRKKLCRPPPTHKPYQHSPEVLEFLATAPLGRLYKWNPPYALVQSCSLNLTAVTESEQQGTWYDWRIESEMS